MPNPWDEDTTHYTQAQRNAHFWRCWTYDSMPKLRAAWDKYYASPERQAQIATLFEVKS